MDLKSKTLLLAVVCLLMPAAAYAHTGLGNAHGFMHGFGHPVGGLDHVLAMVAVGIWAAQAGGRTVWAIPAGFVSLMAFGGFLGLNGITVPLIEEGIATSVLVLGLFVTVAARFPVALSVVIVGVFAIFHGHAHGAEIPGSASGLAYSAGFVISTALLHLCGIGIGIAFKVLNRIHLMRYAGGLIAAGGAWLLFSL
ncbi:MAG: HupE/UreJ family protein [Deltaproteobacteria bacterium]|nr:HupE/UreJ family protein [Deltaproteobacteria bacterium]MBZ0219902.1 HupE/UreJ family protein [Deltaproteobacteria bacterium]